MTASTMEEQTIDQIRARIRENKLDLRNGFKAFDSNGDGKITRTEFINAFKAMSLGLSPADVDRMFKYFDTNNSGSIDYHSFCFRMEDAPQWVETSLVQVRQRIAEKNLNLRQAFGAFDTDKNGMISLSEFRQTFAQMQFGLSEGQVDDLFKHFDYQNRGEIDFRTFCEKIEGR